MARVRLADLYDLEWLLSDPEAPSVDERRRAKEAASALAARHGHNPEVFATLVRESRRLRREFCLEWLENEREHRNLPGHEWDQRLGSVRWILVAVAILSGIGLASAALSYDGSEPVNVQWFALVCVLLPGLQLLISVVAMLGGFGRGPVSLFWPFLQWVSRRVDRSAREGKAADAHSTARVLRSRAGGYAPLLRWRAFASTQVLGLCYLGAALVTLIALGVFSDLRFGWATTLDVSAEQVHSIVDSASTPFRSVVADSVPDLEAVRATQWDRLDGGYVVSVEELGAEADARRQSDSAIWWRFLGLLLAAWALIPRLFVFAFVGVRTRQLASKLDFDHAGFQRLLRAALVKSTGFAGPEGNSVRGQRPEEVAPTAFEQEPSRKKSAPKKSGAAGTTTWSSVFYGRSFGDPAAATAVGRSLGLKLESIGSAGEDLDAEDATITAIASKKPKGLVLICEASSQPTKELLGFIQQARRKAGDGSAITVFLATDSTPISGAESERLSIWRRSIAQLGDPNLDVLTFEEGG
ncbi:MAG: DUF2868 domain-containing protein [Planctomycetota bacterium]